jgi:hypothetical protein
VQVVPKRKAALAALDASLGVSRARACLRVYERMYPSRTRGLLSVTKPDYVLISDPLRRLDRRISGRIHLSGIADLRRKSTSS